MNILFFLTPKANCSYLEEDDTMRQALERMEQSGFSALPILRKDGTYCGTLTEGDLLWALKKLCVMDLKQTEEHTIMEIAHRRDNRPVSVSTDIECFSTLQISHWRRCLVCRISSLRKSACCWPRPAMPATRPTSLL